MKALKEIVLFVSILTGSFVHANQTELRSIIVTGAEAERLAQLATLRSGQLADHVVCVPGKCHISNELSRNTFEDQNGEWSTFLKNIGVPEVRDLNPVSLGLAGERRFNVECRKDDLGKLQECTLSASGLGKMSHEKSLEVISLIHPDASKNTVNGEEVIDAWAYCKIITDDGVISQYCGYSKGLLFESSDQTPIIESARAEPEDRVNRGKGQFLIQGVLAEKGYNWDNLGSAPYVNTSYGRIICSLKDSSCQAMKF